MSSGIQKDVLLSEHTSFKIGGPAKYFFIGTDEEEISRVISWAKEKKEKIFILGGGSKVLFDDEGFDGLVVKVAGKEEIKMLSGNNNIRRLRINAGCRLAKLASYCYEHTLSGMEWCVGIPGISLGGAIVGNAGAFGKSTGDLVKKVKILSLEDGRIIEMDNKECQFAYRESIFKKNPTLFLILEADLEFMSGEKETIRKNMADNLKFRTEKQILAYPNAGSIFKNAAIVDIKADIKNIPEQFKNDGVVPAGWLLEHSNLKGTCIGGALISDKHANFIINTGRAKADDVKQLIILAKSRVKEKFGIQLEEEIIIASCRDSQKS